MFPASAGAADAARDHSFDADWRFLRADAPGAEQPGYVDTAWRTLDIPHDWSIEDLPPIDSSIAQVSAVSGQWRFQKGDDLAWNDPMFDDSGWQEVTLPDYWERHSGYTNENAYGWFRRHLQIPAEIPRKGVRTFFGPHR